MPYGKSKSYGNKKGSGDCPQTQPLTSGTSEKGKKGDYGSPYGGGGAPKGSGGRHSGGGGPAGRGG